MAVFIFSESALDASRKEKRTPYPSGHVLCLSGNVEEGGYLRRRRPRLVKAPGQYLFGRANEADILAIGRLYAVAKSTDGRRPLLPNCRPRYSDQFSFRISDTPIFGSPIF